MICDARKPPEHINGYDPLADVGDCHYDAEAAERVVGFFERCLVFTKGVKAKDPFRLERWQQDIVKTLFGWKRPDGTRRYREGYIAVPRKNGKSTFIAGIANYMLFCDGEQGAELYCAASDREQASLVFSSAANMIRNSEYLNSICKIRDSTKRIIYKGSFLRAIPANEGGSHGFDSHFIVGDELHAWYGREFHDVLHTSTGARSQPLELYITTSGYDRNSICWEKHTYASQVRDKKVIDPTFFPAIWQADEADDWTSEDVWRKANPNLGVSISLDYLAKECEKAKANPRYENTFRRLHLNQWTSQDARWLQIDRWRSCRISNEPFTDGLTVYGALDLSSTVDITAWALVHRRDDGGYRVKMHYWIPGDRVSEAEKRDRVPYRQWAKTGYVTISSGAAIDYDLVHRRILEDCDRYEVGAVGYDPWNAEPTRILLEAEGVTMVKLRQGYATLSGPSKELERAVIEGQLDHGGDPVLEWMADNVQVRTDENGNIRPVKPEHNSGKRIDGIVALIMALAVAAVAPQRAASVYDTEWDF